MLKGKEKGINPLISAIFILVITIAGITIVLRIGMPAIEEAREGTVLSEARQNLGIIESMIDTVKHGAKSETRTDLIEVNHGEYHINGTDNTIRFEYDVGTDFISPEICRKDGNVWTKTYGSGRVLDLRMDEGEGNETKDCSPYGNDGDIYGANWTETDYGTALDFDGENDYVDISSSDLKLSSGETFSLWAKPLQVGDSEKGRYPGLAAESIDAYDGYMSLESGDEETYTEGEDVDLTFTGETIKGTVGIISTDYSYTVGEWIHITLKRDDEGELYFYVDGTLLGSDSAPSDEDFSLAYLGVGYGQSLNDGRFYGSIDDVRVYDRALSESEIEVLANRGSVGEARELELEFSPDNVNITDSLRLGPGKHRISVRNSGYEGRQVKIDVSRI